MRLFKTLLGLTAGVAAGIPVGYIVHATVSLYFLPEHLWTSDALRWSFLLATSALFGAAGAVHGWRQDRASRLVFRACAGFLTGSLLAIVFALLFLFAALWLLDDERAAYPVAAAFMLLWPFGLLGGLIGAWRAAARVARED